jgi:hypothetical protein
MDQEAGRIPAPPANHPGSGRDGSGKRRGAPRRRGYRATPRVRGPGTGVYDPSPPPLYLFSLPVVFAIIPRVRPLHAHYRQEHQGQLLHFNGLVSTK